MRNAVTIFELRFGQNSRKEGNAVSTVNQLVRRFFLEKNGVLVVGTIYSRINSVNTTYCEK